MACGRRMFVPGLRSIRFLSQFSSQSTKRERRKAGISPAVGIYTPKCQRAPSTEILTPALLFPVQDGGKTACRNIKACYGKPLFLVTSDAGSTAQRNAEQSLGKAGRRQQSLLLLEAEGTELSKRGQTPLQAVRLCRSCCRFQLQQGRKPQGSELKPAPRRKEQD